MYDKLDRAQVHLVDVELECVRVARLYREAISIERDVEGGDYVWRISNPPLPQLDFSAIVGDAIHNLRCALDHLAYALVDASGNKPTTHPYFPIFAEVPGRRRPSLLDEANGLDDEIRAALDEVQPYNRDVPQFHQLWLLHRLDIIDKHRKLLVAVIGLADLSWSGGDAKLVHVNRGPYEDGDELCRFRIASPDLAEQFKEQISFRVRFDEPEAGVHGFSKPVDQVIEMIADYIETWLLPKFVPSFL